MHNPAYSTRPGTVWLVGAGSLDPDLISVKGNALLRQCDVVVYDDLIHPDLIKRASSARLIYAGKRSGRHSMNQQQINALLASLAREYGCIVRLKGGDPFIFGRGMEEMLYLESQSIPVHVIPGIPSALAVSSFAHIPLTHRQMAGSVTFLTGHTQSGIPAEDPAVLARMKGTLAVFMGLSSLDSFASSLMEAGKNPDTPCGVLSGLTASSYTGVFAPLFKITEKARQARIPAPALILIGEVCRFYQKPEKDQILHLSAQESANSQDDHSAEKTILLDGYGSLDFCRRLQSRLPESIRIRPVLQEIYADHPQAIIECLCEKKWNWIALFSRHGAAVFIQTLKQNHIDLRSFAGTRFAAIGSGTAGILEEAGIYPDLVPAVFTSAALAAELASISKRSKEKDILLLRSSNADHLAQDFLGQAGFNAVQCSIYDLNWQIRSETAQKKGSEPIDLRKADGAVIASGMAAGLIQHNTPVLFCLSPRISGLCQQQINTSEPVRKTEIIAADKPDIDAIAGLIASRFGME